ncbi:hypothetical protein Tco_0195786 [Tanacetum coccineum]
MASREDQTRAYKHSWTDSSLKARTSIVCLLCYVFRPSCMTMDIRNWTRNIMIRYPRPSTRCLKGFGHSSGEKWRQGRPKLLGPHNGTKEELAPVGPKNRKETKEGADLKSLEEMWGHAPLTLEEILSYPSPRHQKKFWLRKATSTEETKEVEVQEKGMQRIIRLFDDLRVIAAQLMLLEVIENGNIAPKTTVVEGVEKVIPSTTAEEKAEKRLELNSKGHKKGEVKEMQTLYMMIYSGSS